jgi:hypothetical protein
MTSNHDLLPAGAAMPDPGATTPGCRPARPHGRRAAMLLAAAAPLAAAALASAPVATAPVAAPPAATTARPGQTHAAELLTTATLPATTAGTGGGDPKIPPFVGD